MTREEIVLQLTLEAMSKNTAPYALSSERGAEASKAIGNSVATLFNTIWENLVETVSYEDE